MGEAGDGLVTVFLCGDVMTGRGVDQVLPHPGDPELRERHAGDARAYVRLAERAHGPIPRPAGFAWPWGDALRVLEDAVPDVRVRRKPEFLDSRCAGAAFRRVLG